MTTGIALAVYALSLLAGAIAVWRRPVAAVYLWIVGVAVHNAVGAALYGAGVRGSALTAIQAWKEILLAVALACVATGALRVRELPFRPGIVDAMAVAYGALVCVYAVIPQHTLGGSADGHAVGLALKHDLIPVAAFFVGRSLVVRREELVRLAWTIVGAAAVVAALGLIDVYAISISWWRTSAVVPYFNKRLGDDYHGTGNLPENFIYNVGAAKPCLRWRGPCVLSRGATAAALAVSCGPDGIPHRTADQGRRVELHGDGGRDGDPRLDPLDGVGRSAVRRARAESATNELVGRGRGRVGVRRRARPGSPDGRDRRSVDGVRALVPRRTGARDRGGTRPEGRNAYRCR